MISFIMMAKNTEKYIGKAISSLQQINDIKWELIIIDDHSNDNTLEIVKNFAKKDNRIKIFKNKFKGKVMGTNYGYSLSKGNIIKCIDSDDVLLPDFFKFYNKMKEYPAHCHNAYITDEKLNIKSIYNVNPLMLTKDYKFILEHIVGLPKWSWSFKREIAEKIFPMPENLPFEDAWMAFMIKQHAKKIYFIDKPVYLYRQHKNQTFGGILNFEKDVVIFRAKRLLKLIEVLKNEERILNGLSPSVFNTALMFYRLMAKEEILFSEVINSDLKLNLKAKIILIKKFPTLAKQMSILKWKIKSFFN